MIAYLLPVSVCLGLFYALYYAVLRRETLHVANRLYLLATLLAGLLIPLLEIRLDRPVAAPVLQSAIQAGTRVGEWPEVVIRASAASAIDWASLAMGGYAVVSLLLLVRLAAGLLRISSLERGGQRVEIDGSGCLMSDRITTPFSFGKIIYLPARLQLDEQALRLVLRHEQAHVRQRHSVDVLLVEVIAAICWIVPFVHLYRRAIREVHEYAADAAVLRDSAWEPYARLLLAQQRASGQPALAHSFHSSTLKNRIMMMHRGPSARGAALKYAGILPVLTIAVASFAFQVPGYRLSGDRAEALPGELSNIDARQDALAALHDFSQPRFPGCGGLVGDEAWTCSNGKLVEYLRDVLSYPASAIRDGVNGTIIVRFIVDEEGWVRDPKVLKSLTADTDQAALDVIRGMNDKVGRWTPAMEDGKPVAFDMAVPFSFQLDDPGAAQAIQDVDRMPVLPGCNALPAAEQEACTSNRLMQFIGAQLTYPADERKRGIEGRGVVTFVVGTDGRLRDVRLKESVSPGIDAEIMRIADELAKLPNPWTPAMRDGKPVAMEMTLPILFKLSE
jgi:TonB family protein